MTQIADRLFLSLLTFVMVLAAVFTPGVEQNGFIAHLSLMAFGALSLIALLDVLINDLLPKRYHFKTGLRLRQGIWLWMGVTYVGYAFVNVKASFDAWIPLICVLCAFRAAAVAFIDLQESMDSKRRDRRATDLKPS